MHGRTVGVFGGVGAVISVPIGFWAGLPKRHVIITLFAGLSLYPLDLCRTETDTWRSRQFRAPSYVWVEFSAWVMTMDAVVLLSAIGIIDLTTVRLDDIWTLSIIGGVFLVSMMPFFLTNYLIAGSPLNPPNI